MSATALDRHAGRDAPPGQRDLLAVEPGRDAHRVDRQVLQQRVGEQQQRRVGQPDHVVHVQHQQRTERDRDREDEVAPPADAEQADHGDQRVAEHLDRQAPQRAVDRRRVRVVLEHPRQVVLLREQQHVVPQEAPGPRVAEVAAGVAGGDERAQQERGEQHDDDVAGHDPQQAARPVADEVRVALPGLHHEEAAHRHERGDGQRAVVVPVLAPSPAVIVTGYRHRVESDDAAGDHEAQGAEAVLGATSWANGRWAAPTGHSYPLPPCLRTVDQK
jgi:hypothetical protein